MTNNQKLGWAAVIALVLLMAGLIWVIWTQDDSPSPTTEDYRQAAFEWSEAGPYVQGLVCEVFNETGRDNYVFIDETMSEGEKEAKLDLFESECEE